MSQSRLRRPLPLLWAALLAALLAACQTQVTPALAPTPEPATSVPTRVAPLATVTAPTSPVPTRPPTPTAAAPLATLPPAAAPKAFTRPNIILLLTDDLDLTLGSIESMPKLKSLMREQGVTFSNFFVSLSLCCPSRSTILRGQYGHNTGILTNRPPNGGYERFHELGREESTVATWLQAAGYRTALLGKYLNGYPKSVDPTYVPPGWTEWDSPSAGNPYAEYDYQMNENGKLVAYGSRPEDFMVDVLSRKATDFIRQSSQARAPFFLYLATYAPHGPSTAAPRHESLFADARAPRPPSFNEEDVSDKPAWMRRLPALSQPQLDAMDAAYRKRLRSLQSVDDLLATLVETLKATGQDNTYIFFTSDNGFHMGEHRLANGKNTGYDDDLRVPLIVRGPGIPAGQTVPHLALNTDFAPTFAELAGVTPPDFVDGRSLVPLLKGNPPSAEAWRKAVLLEHATPEKAKQAKARLSPAERKQRKELRRQKRAGTPTPSVAGGGPTPDSRARPRLTTPQPKQAQATPTPRPRRANATPAPPGSRPRRTPTPTPVPARKRATPTPSVLEPPDEGDDQTAGNKGGVPPFQGVRTADYAYIEYATGERELYDLRQDPYELQNIAASADPRLVRQLSAWVAALHQCAGATCRRAEDALPERVARSAP